MAHAFEALGCSTQTLAMGIGCLSPWMLLLLPVPSADRLRFSHYCLLYTTGVRFSWVVSKGGLLGHRA